MPDRFPLATAKPGLDNGWMSLQEDVYVLHGGFANIRITEEERLKLSN